MHIKMIYKMKTYKILKYNKLKLYKIIYKL